MRIVTAQENYPTTWPTAPADYPSGLGRVVKIIIEGQPEQVATITSVSTDGPTWLYLPDTDEYVAVEWREAKE